MEDLKTMNLSEIADLIQLDWQRMSPYAQPYVSAMSRCHDMDSQYGYEKGVSQVAYFMGNAQTWRGETARAVKKELNRRLHNYYHPQDQKS